MIFIYMKCDLCKKHRKDLKETCQWCFLLGSEIISFFSLML